MRGLAPARGAAAPGAAMDFLKAPSTAQRGCTSQQRLAPRAAAAQAAVATVRVASSGAASVLGSVRKRNEDRFDIQVSGRLARLGGAMHARRGRLVQKLLGRRRRRREYA